MFGSETHESNHPYFRFGQMSWHKIIRAHENVINKFFSHRPTLAAFFNSWSSLCSGTCKPQSVMSPAKQNFIIHNLFESVKWPESTRHR